MDFTHNGHLGFPPESLLAVHSPSADPVWLVTTRSDSQARTDEVPIVPGCWYWPDPRPENFRLIPK